MGNRIYTEVQLLAKDMAKIEQILGCPPWTHWYADEQGPVRTVWEEEGTAWQEEAPRLAKEHIMFLGKHDPGPEMDAGLFVSWNGEYVYVNGNFQDMPVVTVEDDLKMNIHELAAAQRYLELKEKAEAFLSLKRQETTKVE